MFPTFTLGPWTLKTYTVVYSLALIICGMIAFHRLQAGNQSLPRTRVNLPLIILAGIGGTYLITIIPALIDLARTGRFDWHVHGNYFGTLLAVTIASRLLIPSDRWGRSMDLGGLPWPLFQAIGRIGCLGAGCCYGRPTDSWIGRADAQRARRMGCALSHSDHERHRLHDYLYPPDLRRTVGIAQGASEGIDGAACIWPFDGLIYLLYFNLYCVDRFAMECLRGDAVPLVGPFSWVHFVTFAGWLTLTIVIIRNWRRARAASAQTALQLP